MGGVPRTRGLRAWLSCRLAPEIATDRGRPVRSVIKWICEPQEGSVFLGDSRQGRLPRIIPVEGRGDSNAPATSTWSIATSTRSRTSWTSPRAEIVVTGPLAR